MPKFTSKDGLTLEVGRVVGLLFSRQYDGGGYNEADAYDDLAWWYGVPPIDSGCVVPVAVQGSSRKLYDATDLGKATIRQFL